MSDAQTVTTFLGWCTVINMGLLCLAAAVLMLGKDWVAGIHSRMTGVAAAELPGMYFQYLGNYKLLIFIFNLAPYAALKVMG